MPLNKVFFEASKLVSTKTLLLKHYYRHQGKWDEVCLWVIRGCQASQGEGADLWGGPGESGKGLRGSLGNFPGYPRVRVLNFQWTAKGASGKGPCQRNVKNRQKCQEYFDTFRHFRAGQNRQNSPKILSTLLDNFRAAPVFRPLLGLLLNLWRREGCYMYPKIVGDFIVLLICPWSELMFEIYIFLCLEHGPTELHIWLWGELVFLKTCNKIRQVTAGRINQATISSKTKGPGEKGAPRDHPEISSQRLANFECGFPYDSYGRDRASFWPLLGEGFWGNIRRALVLPAPLFFCWNDFGADSKCSIYWRPPPPPIKKAHMA